VDVRLEYEPLGVYQQVTLSSFDLLAPVVTPMFSSYRCSLDRLRINHSGAELRISLQANPETFSQSTVDPLPAAIDAPFPEVVVDGGPSREVVRQEPPLASGLQEVEDGVEDLAKVVGRPCPLGAGR